MRLACAVTQKLNHSNNEKSNQHVPYSCTKKNSNFF
uniref:Uncharacterized protein n=1 Tax=Arundo donax TaxID=35708 RepID=A0A0A9EJV9_ARUDO